MSQIASPQNPRLKALRRLHTRRERARTGTFLAEGEDLVAAAALAGRPALAGYRLAGSGLGQQDFHDVEPATLAGVSTLGSSSRVIGVYEQRWQEPVGPLCVYLHGVGDPGNVGAVLRSALAFGASSVALGPGCADPHSPKAVRASMGAIFSVALARASDVDQLPRERIALCADASEPLRGPGDRLAQANSGTPGGSGALPALESVTLLIGAERYGLPVELIAACERSARIPIASDSLNAAMAASVALYEMTRQGGRDNDTVPAS
jgi:RNA methyltransferase, TrmH family